MVASYTSCVRTNHAVAILIPISNDVVRHLTILRLRNFKRTAANNGEWKVAATAPDTDDARAQDGIIAENAGSGMTLSCRVKYSVTEPLHLPWGNNPVEDGANTDADGNSLTRSTLLVQACWDSGGHCGEWGLTSKPLHTVHGQCTIAGPRVTSPVPSPEQRKTLYRAFVRKLCILIFIFL